jgi:hypothetical protein
VNGILPCGAVHARIFAAVIGFGFEAAENRSPNRRTSKRFDDDKTNVLLLREGSPASVPIGYVNSGTKLLKILERRAEIVRRLRKEVQPSTRVRIREEASRIKQGVILDIVAIDVVSLNK